MKILLDFNAKLEREHIFKPTIGNESLHHDRNDNGVRIVNSATSKNEVVQCLFNNLHFTLIEEGRCVGAGFILTTKKCNKILWLF